MVSQSQAYWMKRRKGTKPAHQVLSAELSNVAGDVNVRGKLKGKLVMNLTNLVTYAAQGALAADPWRPVGTFDASRDVTPA